ncbi:unnamed protein product [Linum trigynum]|uniref:Uncharacterized protein n=1 Tax=Linum trigynum TaxID=586398 RepID=A0AAV2FRC2_9ROSI
MKFPPMGMSHQGSAHIAKMKGPQDSSCAIDNGSALNVIPNSTLHKLLVDESYIKPSFIVVRAFDGTKRKVIGEIELSIQIGPSIFNISFQVMDITPTYNLLLGRPWIHSTRAVPSSLHQKVKFIIGNKLVGVYGEEDIMIMKTPDAPYIEAIEETLESAFQSLEIEDVAYVNKESKAQDPRPSIASIMASKQIIKGIDKSMWNTLIRLPMNIKENKNCCGLGYSSSREDMKRF